MTDTDYLGTDTRQYQEAVEQDDQVVVAFTHEHYGRLRFPLDREKANELRTDLDGALLDLELNRSDIPEDDEGGGSA